ncbi:MAG: hypothetical protein JWM56_24 [Candidatus Peribacteria bacterium]|nr:hypothetical protein [Candidatus Peribacteria bacterium]
MKRFAFLLLVGGVLGMSSAAKAGFDPLGDTFGSGYKIDLIQYSLTEDDTNYYATIVTANAFASPLDLADPQRIGGLFEFDTDNNPDTGYSPHQNTIGHPLAERFGSDFMAAIFGITADDTVTLFDTRDFSSIQVKIAFDLALHSVTLTIPKAAFGNPTTDIYGAVAIGATSINDAMEHREGVTPRSVPEPSSFGLIVLGLGGATFFCRRKKR